MQFKEMKKWASRCGYMVEYSQVMQFNPIKHGIPSHQTVSLSPVT